MGLFNAVMALSGMIDTDVIEDERLARHTSYRIGGKADLFVTCHSYHALRRAVAVLSPPFCNYPLDRKQKNEETR